LTPRPRSRDKVVPVSIGIPVSLMLRLDNELDWKQSRSRWVKSAIISKLEQQSSFDVSTLSTIRLLVLLFNRGVITYEYFTQLKKQVEETVEEQ